MPDVIITQKERSSLKYNLSGMAVAPGTVDMIEFLSAAVGNGEVPVYAATQSSDAREVPRSNKKKPKQKPNRGLGAEQSTQSASKRSTPFAEYWKKSEVEASLQLGALIRGTLVVTDSKKE